MLPRSAEKHHDALTESPVEAVVGAVHQKVAGWRRSVPFEHADSREKSPLRVPAARKCYRRTEYKSSNVINVTGRNRQAAVRPSRDHLYSHRALA
ncbi:MAG: hypothetical protein ACK56F_00950 [bacterium]